DVAVIQIPAKNLTELPVADSSRLRVGDFVVAIGNPFGLGQTVTSGIISALGRSGLGIEGYEDFIQTDASINPGNSGGALVNLNGELIGINTAIIAPSGGNVGIGFAIPANMALQLMSSLVKHGEVRRGLLGVSVQDLSPDLARAFDLDRSTGAVISRVQAESPAEQAGLETGDIILAINGRSVANSAGVRNAIGLMQVGDQVELEVIHEGRKIARSARIAKPETVGVDGGLIHPTLSGTRLSMTAPGQGEGVLFSEIIQTSYPWAVGLRPGDIIINANNYRIRTLDELQSIAAQRRSLLIRIQRDNEAFIVHLQ
ncbi:MAG: PDZ domain-containing protein, partial [Methylococcaceae bacterium]|nr:PDZ domain-containing protein [Methylococcaceae bacterium]